ncbi:hypothetical protein, partial [Stenotrophomonas sp. YIM B06876]|uniref:hypothetical protein n=1 Tax=Stenotrophomonas sp. YIM B06876 TaxID=3060211 RepID=UPI0027396B55
AFMGRVVGNQTTVTFGGNGTPIVTSSAGLGTPAIGNMGLSQSGTGVSLAGNVKVPVAGTSKTVDAIARAPITRAAFLAGLGAVVSNPLVGIGLSVAAPFVANWLMDGGVRMNTNASDYPGKPFLLEKDFKWKDYLYSNESYGPNWFSSPYGAANEWARVSGYPHVNYSVLTCAVYSCVVRTSLKSTGAFI